MGIFGPTKKGGGLDMRFKSNSGGYLGKTASLVSGLSALASTASQEDNTPDRNPLKIWWVRKMNSRKLDKKINEQLLDSFENNKEYLEEYNNLIKLSKTDQTKYLQNIDETIQTSFELLRREGFSNLLVNGKRFETASEQSLINSKRKTFIGYYVRTKSFKSFLGIVKKEIDRLNETDKIELSKLVKDKYKKAKRKAFFISGNFFIIIILIIPILVLLFDILRTLYVFG
jgi:hypothetical protein